VTVYTLNEGPESEPLIATPLPLPE